MDEDGFLDRPVAFECNDELLSGIVSEPKNAFDSAVIIVVGGPQFRVGSHRQFVLLARYLAQQGVLALRFDYTGMGYSAGLPKQFFEVDQDINAALDFVQRQYPQVKKIFLWGLCDAASAISFSAYTQHRVDGIILLNPWVRSEASHSEAILKNYYKDRIFSVEVWKQLLGSPHKIYRAVISLLGVSFKVLMNMFVSKGGESQRMQEISLADRQDNLVASVLTGLTRFHGDICLLLSENDLTADEFKREFENSGWMQDSSNAKKMIVHNISEADHTFSSDVWRKEVEAITMQFIRDYTD